MKTSERTVHVIAQCQQCQWRSEDFRKGVRKAIGHHADTGHTVSVERGTVFKFEVGYHGGA